MQPEHAPGALTLREMVNGIGAELALLTAMVERLQDALGGQPGAGGASESLQCLDLVTQSLAALSGFLALAARGVDPALQIDLTAALATIKVAQIAHRLAMHSPVASQPGVPAGAQHVAGRDRRDVRRFANL